MMADRPRITNPRVHVVMDDGGEWDAQTLNPDILRYEATAAKHKWPGAEAAPMRWMTFLSWRAGLREGHIPPDVTWEEFSENGPRMAISITEAGSSTPVDPTRSAADTG